MARSAAAAAPRSGRVDLAGMAMSVVLVLVLALLLAWPLAAVFGEALRSAPPPLTIVGLTLAVAGAATLGALGMAAVVAAAVRVGAPGHTGLVAICRVGVLVPPFIVPLALLALSGAGGPAGRGHGAEATVLALLAIAVAQAFAFLPHAAALVMSALAGVPAEAEQAAELLGASRWTVLRRVTLGSARRGLAVAMLVVLGLCLADVTAPLLLGLQDPAPAGLMLLAGLTAGGHATGSAAAGALALSALTIPLAMAGRTWRHVITPYALAPAPPSGLRPAAPVRAVIAMLAWLITTALIALWVVVPLASLAHWTGLRGAARSLLTSAALGLGVALVGTVLALAAAWLSARARGPAAGAVAVLAGVPVAVAGVAGGAGYLAAFGAPGRSLALVVLLVAAWELPVMLRVAGNVLARAERSTEQAALTLGATPLTTLRRVVLPSLTPSVAWLLCHGFATGATAAGTVAAFALAQQRRPPLAILDMLTSASTGSVGAACAVATVLLALASGATLLGRAAAGRESIPTLLA